MTEVVVDSTKEALWLIGFSINPDTQYPEVYTLFLPGDIDEPLVSEGYIIFFSEPKLARKALELCSNDIQNFTLPSEEVDLICDIATSLYLIDQEDIDPSATIVNFLNILLDLIKATKLPIPVEYKRILYAFADHLTFSREISTFFIEQHISRSAIIDAIVWGIGAVVSKSKIITESSLIFFGKSQNKVATPNQPQS